jgi:hypothetical protein
MQDFTKINPREVPILVLKTLVNVPMVLQKETHSTAQGDLLPAPETSDENNEQ